MFHVQTHPKPDAVQFMWYFSSHGPRAWLPNLTISSPNIKNADIFLFVVAIL